MLANYQLASVHVTIGKADHRFCFQLNSLAGSSGPCQGISSTASTDARAWPIHAILLTTQ